MKGKPSEPAPLPLRRHNLQTCSLVFCVALAMVLARVSMRGDQVEMQNGDRYAGKVLSLNTNTLVLQSEVLGTLRLPRNQVALIALGAESAGGVTNSIRLRSGTNEQWQAADSLTKTDPGLLAAIRKLGKETNSLQQVQKELLSSAGPEANKKFSELLSGYLTGKLSVNDIRVQAKSAADQVRELKRELGEDAGFALDGYLSILDSFLKETAPPGATNAAAAKRSAKTTE